ncbi:hypothetical protein MPSI1_001279 [Malassezia psittaci]|uniref:Uncharacterized protein n=1 Tax=Malassezia psittaci TaxID=1821823 RepID=A0AAF0F4M4_9BASI|nr:hypothetical protein MPSI1_001279 [Malassezia psittaci]
MSTSGRISPALFASNEYLQAMQARHPQAYMSPESSRQKRRNRMSLFARQTPANETGWNGFERIVGFDTMPDAEDTVSGSASYTLQIKSIGHSRTKHTRTFMCAVDATESRYVAAWLTFSERALEWIMGNLVDDGDEIVAVRVLDNEQDELNGNTRKSSILRLVTMYRPESLTIGTRGKQVSALEKMLGTTPLGNLSKSLIWQSPVPVIIVRPEDRVKKHLLKRMSDPRRHEYYDLVQHDENLPMSLPEKDK